ncbi:MAG: site-2 protease family protein [Planctomycetota bacterium]
MGTLFSVLLAILGIGLLVFIHEAGHFIAARLCGVHCYVFSLGYGPRVWGFVKNGCDFRISAIPVGGYVRMAGDIGENDDAPAADSLAAKSPLKRIFVYSAGVMMNFAIAFVIFPIVYAAGVPSTRPVIGAVVPGSPAWKVNMIPGSVILSVNGTRMDTFEQIPIEIAVAPSPVQIVWDEPILTIPSGESVPDHKEIRYRRRDELITTEYDPEKGAPYLGIERAERFAIVTTPESHATIPAARFACEVAVIEGSPAHRAGVRTGDFLVAIDGRPPDFNANKTLFEPWQDLGSAPVLRFEPGANTKVNSTETHTETRSVAQRSAEVLANLRAGVRIAADPVPNSARPILGVVAARDRVRGVRNNSTIAQLGIQAGDRILFANNKAVSNLDELKLATEKEPTWRIVVERGESRVLLEARIEESARAGVFDSLGMTESDGLSRITVRKNSPAEKAGMISGDQIVMIGAQTISEWSDIRETVSKAKETTLKVEVQRPTLDGANHKTTIPEKAGIDTKTPARTPGAAEGTTTHLLQVAVDQRPDLIVGLQFVADHWLLKADGLGDAFRLGFSASTRFIKQIVVFLKKIALGQVSAKKSVAGPILLAVTTYHVASEGLIQLLFFLGVLSLNLALINLLPIPLLDGGNLFFVIVEAIKGSPVSDRVMGAAQTVGIFLLIALMVWVTFHDVRRVFFGVF